MIATPVLMSYYAASAADGDGGPIGCGAGAAQGRRAAVASYDYPCGERLIITAPNGRHYKVSVVDRGPNQSITPHRAIDAFYGLVLKLHLRPSTGVFRVTVTDTGQCAYPVWVKPYRPCPKASS